ncbi:hypothetical protein SAMN05444008_11559 [Cnuella takakiae]|uniref:Uncharacterized protein n=1 Tax=Cnuella takakiae TaxID=1302690 RepID=A0A1M5G162_9BACT|nr:hypothetical protein [Cnuella takakiae]OLY92293.1 hypothetical protein BUE76_10605 [Cnuella takakiae]SHF97505.1 hypothetical protein SAMN05444008_11559 [Cnuella takakiae]
MHGDFITLKEVLSWMDSGSTFSIAFITANQRTKTGGELIEIAEGQKSGWQLPEDRKKQEKLQAPSEGVRKAPNHYENSTRNIRIVANNDIRKVHIRLIRKFNGKTVL